MKIFALQTDKEKLIKDLMTRSEQLILAVGFHGLRFTMRLLIAFLYTVALTLIAWGAIAVAIPATPVVAAACIAWIALIGWPLFTGFIDWRYDLLVVTSEKIVIINQSSIVHQHVRQMNLENLASVETETQFWGMFPFGKLCFNLKEGTGQRLCLGYIPQSARICSIISDVLVQFQRRQGGVPHKA